ncbi:unnamed protein product [Didymodactylos carnosus]|uniref:Uncharacterized protein n=1 Tax=Didymodactylos carnosus TaxID=1234261 RepID=A0A814QPR7_9BILA|nr:unnamed protein product [Didymodactylos carnosus]CAF1122638.1 unnamed protein product [Didymodactylos carnosus]CAF3821126.1 unnamed protein product [Didymodactylos carnosus]CAF3886207.1 unnamed protein product [Didymodactylos carnosus]
MNEPSPAYLYSVCNKGRKTECLLDPTAVRTVAFTIDKVVHFNFLTSTLSYRFDEPISRTKELNLKCAKSTGDTSYVDLFVDQYMTKHLSLSPRNNKEYILFNPLLSSIAPNICSLSIRLEQLTSLIDKMEQLTVQRLLQHIHTLKIFIHSRLMNIDIGNVSMAFSIVKHLTLQTDKEEVTFYSELLVIKDIIQYFPHLITVKMRWHSKMIPVYIKLWLSYCMRERNTQKYHSEYDTKYLVVWF